MFIIVYFKTSAHFTIVKLNLISVFLQISQTSFLQQAFLRNAEKGCQCQQFIIICNNIALIQFNSIQRSNLKFPNSKDKKDSPRCSRAFPCFFRRHRTTAAHCSGPTAYRTLQRFIFQDICSYAFSISLSYCSYKNAFNISLSYLLFFFCLPPILCRSLTVLAAWLARPRATRVFPSGPETILSCNSSTV